MAQWRQSTTGRPLEKRALNLKISSVGIKDFGDSRGYSPLDLVIAARATSLSEAFCWLEEKLLPPKEDIEIDLDKIMEAQDAPKTVPEDTLGTDDEQPEEKSAKERIEELLKSIGRRSGSTVTDARLGTDACSQFRPRSRGVWLPVWRDRLAQNLSDG